MLKSFIIVNEQEPETQRADKLNQRLFISISFIFQEVLLSFLDVVIIADFINLSIFILLNFFNLILMKTWVFYAHNKACL